MTEPFDLQLVDATTGVPLLEVPTADEQARTALQGLVALLAGVLNVQVQNLPMEYPLPPSQLAALAPPVAVELAAATLAALEQVTTQAVPDTVLTGSITAAGQVVEIVLPEQVSALGLQFTGTFVGTVVFEGSVDGGVTWNGQQLRGPSTALNNLATSTTTFPSRWRGNVGGQKRFRVRCTAFTSGSLGVYLLASPGHGGTFLLAPIPIGAVDTGNTASTSVAAGASWTGAYASVINVASINVNVTSTQDGVLTVAYSRDGVTADETQTFAVLAGVAQNVILSPRVEFVRASFTNTGVSAATVAVETVLRASPTQTPLLKIAQAVNANTLGAVSKAVVEGANSWAPVVRTVTTTPVRVDSGVAGRRSVCVRARTFQSNGDAIYVGSSSAVGSGAGHELLSRENITLDLAPGAQVWAVGTRAAGNPLEVSEIWDA